MPRLADPKREAVFLAGSLLARFHDQPAEAFLLSSSSALIARKLVQHYGQWRTRYAVDNDGELEIVDEETWLEIENVVDLAAEELNVSIYELLERIAEAVEDIRPSGSGQPGGCGCGPTQDRWIDPDGNPSEVYLPDDYDAYDPEVDFMRCKVATVLYQDILEVYDQLIIWENAQAAEPILSGLYTFLRWIEEQLAASPFAWAVGAVGVVSDLAGLLLSGVADLGATRQAWVDGKPEIICAMIASPTSEGALTNIMEIVENHGGNPILLETLGSPMTDFLFGIPTGMPNRAEYEQRVLDTEPDPDCNGCQGIYCGVQFESVFLGPGQSVQLGSGTLVADGQYREITAVQRPDNGLWYIRFSAGGENFFGSGNPCAISACSTQRMRIYVQGPWPENMYQAVARDCHPETVERYYYTNGEEIDGPRIIAAEFIGDGPFTLNIRLDYAPTAT